MTIRGRTVGDARACRRPMLLIPLVVWWFASGIPARAGFSPEAVSVLEKLARDVPPEKMAEYAGAFSSLPAMTGPQRRAFALDLLDHADFGRNKEALLGVIVEGTGIVAALPEEYRVLVRDSSILFLGSLPEARIKEKIADQLALDFDAAPGQRLLALMQDMPTLQKVGQMLSRNPVVGAEYRGYLIGLENGLATDKESFQRVIRAELGPIIDSRGIQVDPEPLAAGTVAQVIRFMAPQPGGKPLVGVFKTFKPGVAEDVRDELAALKSAAANFNQHRADYPLEKFDFLGLLEKVTEALSRDINLSDESSNLDQARVSFAAYKDIHIPKRIPELCTEHILAMEFIPGGKITEACRDNPAMRAGLARRLFVVTAWQAMFVDGYFHADPHPGNVFFEPAADGRKGRIALIDWSLAERLSPKQRRAMMQLSMGIELRQTEKVLRGLQRLAERDLKDGADLNGLRQDIEAIFRESDQTRRRTGETVDASRSGLRQSLLAPAEGCTPLDPEDVLPAGSFLVDHVLGCAMARGVEFQEEVLYFQKAMMTLYSVCLCLDPRFAAAVPKRKIVGLMVKEIPRRVVFLPRPGARRLPTMISNGDLGTYLKKAFFGLFRAKEGRRPAVGPGRH